MRAKCKIRGCQCYRARIPLAGKFISVTSETPIGTEVINIQRGTEREAFGVITGIATTPGYGFRVVNRYQSSTEVFTSDLLMKA